MSSKSTGGKGGKSKTSAEAKVLTTRSSKAGLQVGLNYALDSMRNRGNHQADAGQFPVGRIHR